MKPERLEELIQLYVSDIMSADERGELSAHLALEESFDGRRQLRRALEADAFFQEMAAESRLPAEFLEKEGAVLGKRDRSLWLGIGALMAALVIGAWLIFGNAGQEEVESRIASVIRIEGELSGDRGVEFTSGSLLQQGETVTMEQGLIEAAFLETGVHLIATAPLSITIKSHDRIFLHEGEVKLHVPPQGIGFVVDTEGSSVTDLGTSFVVSSDGKSSEVLVLDGQVSVADHHNGRDQLMVEGQHARFDPEQKELPTHAMQHTKLPELSFPVSSPSGKGLQGSLYGLTSSPEELPPTFYADHIGPCFIPLIRSGFQAAPPYSELIKTSLVRFRGIAGGYGELPHAAGLKSHDSVLGWMAWYRGNVKPPTEGRYRFWGYADNHLLVGLNGKVVFDGSRFDSSFRRVLEHGRSNHAALPCLNAPAGFAAGEWFSVSEDSMKLDILFGEITANATSGLLLIEREGESYDETYWGQPKWNLFLTEVPTEVEEMELRELRQHMEQKLMGSFSISKSTVWSIE